MMTQRIILTMPAKAILITIPVGVAVTREVFDGIVFSVAPCIEVAVTAGKVNNVEDVGDISAVGGTCVITCCVAGCLVRAVICDLASLMFPIGSWTYHN